MVLAFLLIFLAIQIQVIFEPFLAIIKAIFIPLLLGGVLFYLTYPVQRLLENRLKFPRWASISTIVLLMAIIGYIFYTLIGPAITEQFNMLVETMPSIIDRVQSYINYLVNQRQQLPDQIKPYVNDFVTNIGSWGNNAGSRLWDFVVNFVQGVFYIVLAPFFLIYMLKDHERFAPFISSFFKGKRKKWILKTLHDIDETLKSFIRGQLLVSFLVGILLLIGYFIIGLEYALLMALLGMLLNVIPFLGPYLAVVPAMIVAFFQDPIMAVYVAIIMLIAQQIEGAVITPNVMGNELNIHPLTVIAVVLAAGNLAGFIGILIAVPVYAVIKDIVRNIYAMRHEISETAAREIDND